MRRSATGSCVRCGRALDLASAKVGGVWFGRAACASGGPCAVEGQSTAVRDALINRPRRAHDRRPPKELRRRSA